MAWEITEKNRARVAGETNFVALGAGDRLRVCLCYPNTYSVGMSNLGFQALYYLFNAIPGVRCERAFLPDGAVEGPGAGSGGPLVSLETETPVGNFDVIAFSVAFDLDVVNVPRMLELAGVPVFSRAREGGPVVIAGGVVPTFNPEPMAEMVDAVLMGEAEGGLGPLAEILIEISEGRVAREKGLRALAGAPGIYVPALYEVSYHADGSIAAIEPREGAPEKVERLYVKELEAWPCPSRILCEESEFARMYLVEIARGCPRGCKFCVSGHVWQPVRYRRATSILEQAKEGLRYRDTIGLIGSAVSDHPEIEEIAQGIMAMGGRVSFASVRADRLTAKLLEAIAASGTNSLTLAPEAGTQALRDGVGKGLTEEEILAAVRAAAGVDLRRLRLYFMVGLPGETEGDMRGLAALARRVKGEGMSRVTVSVCAFVPKPQTPYAREAMLARKEIRLRIARLKRELGGIAGMEVAAESPNASYLQGIVSRGDRRLGEVLAVVAKGGGTLGEWRRALAEAGLSGEWYAERARGAGEVAPWGHLAGGCRAAGG